MKTKICKKINVKSTEDFSEPVKDLPEPVKDQALETLSVAELIRYLDDQQEFRKSLGRDIASCDASISDLAVCIDSKTKVIDGSDRRFRENSMGQVSVSFIAGDSEVVAVVRVDREDEQSCRMEVSIHDLRDLATWILQETDPCAQIVLVSCARMRYVEPLVRTRVRLLTNGAKGRKNVQLFSE